MPIQAPSSSVGSPGSPIPVDEGQQPLDVDPGLDLQDRVQIMDLHSRNPIISYRNQIFSCSWADLIGTELLFALPEERPDLPLLRRDKDFDLISASRVKILGQKANLISSSRTKANQVRTEPVSNDQSPTAGSAGCPTSIPQKSGHLTNQARFLERLMNAKRAKGEQDIVPTVFPQKRSQNFESRLRGWAATEARMAEFEQLNRRVLQGDVNAVDALEEIYARMEGPPLEDRSLPLTAAETHNWTASQLPPAHTGSSRVGTEAVGQNGSPSEADDQG